MYLRLAEEVPAITSALRESDHTFTTHSCRCVWSDLLGFPGAPRKPHHTM